MYYNEKYANLEKKCINPLGGQTIKTRIFIGSSIEGIDVAYAIQENLEYIAEITVWDQGVFDLTSTAMHDLISEISRSDFAIFVFHPDDYATIRSYETMIVRDNVVFESGLFIGKLGLYSKHTPQGYSQILSAFLAELETTPFFNKKGTTLFRLNSEHKCLTQIGSSGVVNSDPLLFQLDHNQHNPKEPSFVVHAFENGWGLFQKGTRLGETEYLYTRRIADYFVISIHFLTDLVLSEDEVEQFDSVIYNQNKDIFDSFHVFLKGEIMDGE